MATATEIETEIGLVRGDLKWIVRDVADTSKGQVNLSVLKRWFTAMNVPSTITGFMSLRQLITTYNDTTDTALVAFRTGAALPGKSGPQRLVDIMESPTRAPAPAPAPAPYMGHDDTGEDDEIIETIKPIPTETAAIVPAKADGPVVTDAGKALADLVAPYLSGAVLETVMDAVNKKLASIQVVRLELKKPDGTTKELKGVFHKQFQKVLKALNRGQHVMLVGPAGSGKTTLAHQISEALDLPFYSRGQMTGDHQLDGFENLKRYITTAFRQAYEFGGVLLLDEMDGSDPSVPSGLNAALDNGFHTFPDSPNPVKRHPNFKLIAACNTYGLGADRVYVNRNQLDGAFLNRFYTIEFNYDEALERQLAGNDKWVDRVQAIRHAVFAEKIELLVTPRASIEGAKALADDEIWSDVEDSLIWKGLDKDRRHRIEARIKG